MTDKLKQTIKEEVEKLPKEKQEAINSFDWVKILEEVGKKYLFNESETNDLQVETLLVLVGIEDLDLYANNVENNVGTSKDQAEKITEEVRQVIFIPIYDILVEKIKKSERVKNPNPEQTLDFILSGGDYSVFSEKRGIPDESEGTEVSNVPRKPGRITDIKSKFTI